MAIHWQALLDPIAALFAVVAAVRFWGLIIFFSILYIPINSELYGEGFFTNLGVATLTLVKIPNPSRFEAHYTRIGYWTCFIVSLILAAIMMGLAMNHDYCVSHPYNSGCLSP